MPDYWSAVRDLEAEVSRAHDVTYVDTLGWFCRYGRCPAFVGRTPVFADGSHLTWAYSAQLGPVIAETLFPPKRSARRAARSS